MASVKRAAFLLAAGVLAAGAGGAGAKEPPLYGTVSNANGVVLAHVDPGSLRPLGKGVAVGRDVVSWSFAPNRTKLAIGDGYGGKIRIVDLARMRVRRTIGTVGVPVASAWLAPRRLVWAEPYRIVLVDPLTGRILRRSYTDAAVRRTARAADSLVLLLAPEGKFGPAQLAVAGATGPVRIVTLDRVLAGTSSDEPVTIRLPGLAVDPETRRAFVIGGGEPIAEIDLATLSVRYHDVRTLAAASKGPLDGPERIAAWLGNGLLAVAGSDHRDLVREGDTETMVTTRPSGLQLVDTRTWQMRTLDPAATDLVVAGDRLLAFGRGIGLQVYGSDGFVDLGNGAVVGELLLPMPQLLVGDSALG